MDPAGRLITPATRRTVVRTGVKLAYVAPLVAASVQVHAVNAAARVSTPQNKVCTPYEAFQFAPCETDAQCAAGDCPGYCCLDCCQGCPPGEGVCICLLKPGPGITPTPCARDTECCSGRCERNSGEQSGFCACTPKGGPCLSPDLSPDAPGPVPSATCCTDRCAYDPDSGGGICV